jgi:hypothetical protein
LLTCGLLEPNSIQKLHRYERFAVLVVDFVDGANVQVVHGGSGLGLQLKATEGLRAFGHFIRQELEGDKPTEFDILGLVG